MKCQKCGKRINENENVKIIGTATVYGETTIKKFRSQGIEWNISDSDNEEVICPFCNEPTVLIY